MTWAQFTSELLLRFDDGTAVNEFEAMGVIQKQDTIEDYVAAFVARVAQLPNQSEPYYLGQFL